MAQMILNYLPRQHLIRTIPVALISIRPNLFSAWRQVFIQVPRQLALLVPTQQPPSAIL